MSRMNETARKVIALAYFHRYGWIATMMVCIAIWTEYMMYILCASCILFSIWTFVGYKRKWRHIYCSHQNAYRQEMTPHSIRWNQIKKSDAYGIPLVFFVMGIVLLITIIMHWKLYFIEIYIWFLYLIAWS